MTHVTEKTGTRASYPPAMNAGQRPALPVLGILIVVLAFEFFLFDHFGARRHTIVYPRWNDQIQYLNESYTAYEYARAHGFIAGLWHALTNTSLQGTLHDFFAVIAFTLAGPSRGAALALNMLALMAWQAALFVCVRRSTTKPALAFAAALLPLTLAGPWSNIPGSAYDFRLDHLTMCALGITGAVAWWSDGFRTRAGGLWFGIAVGVTLLTRFLSGTYFVLIFLGLAAWLTALPERKGRLLNLGLAAVVAFVLAAPVFWLNREVVRDYYWVGHYVGPESGIRSSNLGFAGSVNFVATQLLQRHVGLLCGFVAVIVTTLLITSRRLERQAHDRSPWIVGAIFLFGPAIVLVLHQQKSEVVVSALVPGMLMLVIAAWLRAAERASAERIRLVAIGAAGVTLAFFTHTQVPPAYRPAAEADLRLVNALADQIVTRSRTAGLREPRVAVDHITDSLDAQVLRVLGYERQRVLLLFDMTLPTSVVAPSDVEVTERLSRSDFVFLTADASVGPYPYDRKLADLRPHLRAWCEEHLRVANEFTLFGRRMTLYQRREIPFP